MNTALATTDINLDDLQRVAKMLAISGYFDAKGAIEVQIAQVATKIMAGAELGFGPFAAVQGIHLISGKPQISANLMAAAVKAHPRYDYRVRKMSDDGVEIEFFESGQSLGTSEFSKADAAKAKTQNMDKFPRNMLFARALSNGVRWYCPDVFHGNAVYVEGEIEEVTESDRPAIVVVDRETGEVVEGTFTNGNGHKTETETVDDEWPPYHPSGKLPLTAENYEFEGAPDAITWGASMGVFKNRYEATNSFKKHTKDGADKLEKSALWIKTIRTKLEALAPTDAELAAQEPIPF